MRVAALYDIHGNLPALEAVLADVRAADVDRIVIGGDVMPGPMPRECLERLFALDRPTTFIIGNGDRETLAYRGGDESSPIPEMFREAMRWNAQQLTEADARAIQGWPLMARLLIDGIGEVVFCHATPRNDTEIFLKTTAVDKLLPIFDPADASLVVCGHTHMQFDRMVGETRIVNAGSVGMPFQPAGAYWLLIDRELVLRRTAYDLAAAAARVRATAYPQAELFAAQSILQPPEEEAMLAAFAAAELK
jgi:putative phosphoesterase